MESNEEYYSGRHSTITELLARIEQLEQLNIFTSDEIAEMRHWLMSQVEN